ncbi:hypothetical protein WJX81_008571 [Elliptochloris bilobata]|uniref:AAA+ ATPase domain-containing protein n=1 Tax=Elliptochloris bilobata TaxID=381761 RepID=A0AAW1S6H8_9CHLO
MALDARHLFIAAKLSEAYDIPQEAAEQTLLLSVNKVNPLFDAAGPPVLTWYHQPPSGSPAGSPPVLYLGDPKTEALMGKLVYVARAGMRPVTEKAPEAELLAGEVPAAALEGFQVLLAEVFVPLLTEQASWGRSTDAQAHDFLETATRTAEALGDAAARARGSAELALPDTALVDAAEGLSRGLGASRAAADPAAGAQAGELLGAWCATVEVLLAEAQAPPGEGSEAGPEVEASWWRGRAARLASVAEQLRARPCRAVLAVAAAARCRPLKRWRELEAKVADAASEAKANVRCLATLEASLAPLAGGAPKAALAALPALMAALHAMHTVSRYYADPARLAALLARMAAQMERGSRGHILAAGRVWDRPRPALVADLELTVALNEAFHAQFKAVQRQAEGAWALDEGVVFGRYDLFAKRCRKLVSLFTTIHQFSLLAQHTHIEGLEALMRGFGDIIEDIRRKPYDLLDATKTIFDRDFLEFNVHIHDLELAIHGFINASFENIRSTEAALNLLEQFRVVLQRDSLKADLEAKYARVLAAYARDLATVQAQYERHKMAPPLPRNAPRVAGHILWARQLLRRIEAPMQRFVKHKAMLAAKDSKRVVRQYNRLATTLVKFEALWHSAWLSRVEQSRAALHSALIVRHPQTGKPLVNFDVALGELVREAKWLGRLGCSVPEAARRVLLQEHKFKFYYSRLAHLLREYERVVDGVPAEARALLKVHLADLEARLRPGELVLTWASLNVDGFLHSLQQGLARAEELVRQVRDLLANRVLAQLAAVARTRLADLPPQRSFRLDAFVAAQAALTASQTTVLAIRDAEIERGVEELVALVVSYPRNNPEEPLDAADVDAFRGHYAKLLHKAVLAAVKDSFTALRERLVGSGQADDVLPLLEVAVELSVPAVALTPPLAAIQQAAVIGLSGAVEIATAGVGKYVEAFNAFAFLWQRDLASEYAKFTATHPTLEAFEAELKKYMAVEQAVAAVEDLEDVRYVMAVLKEVREREAGIDQLLTPIKDMYGLLVRYEVRVAKEELDAVSDLKYAWKKLRKCASDASDQLASLQAGFRKDLVKEVAAFVLDARAFRTEWELQGPMVPGLDPMEAVDRLKKFQQLFEVRKRKWDSYASGEELFGLPVTQYEGLQQTEKELALLNRLYSLYVNVITTIRGFGDLLWVDVVAQIDGMTEQVVAFQAQSNKLPKALREWQAFHDCKKTIDDFLEQLPLFQQLAHKAMRPRHWAEVMRVTGVELNMAEDVFKLAHLLAANLLTQRDEIEELAAAAVKEEGIEAKLAALTAQWAVLSLTFQDYKTRGPVMLKPSETSELIEALEDSQMALGSMASNRYAAPFREAVAGWLGRLGVVGEQLESWLAVQALWMYMEAVFSGGDIVKQLPAEAKRFQNIDKNFMKIVVGAVETRNVVAVCCNNELLRTMLPTLLEQLEMCQKSLTAYLETKRAEFPRFYFVSDPTLLEILSLGSDPAAVVPHFQSGLFDSLTSVTFDKVDKCKMLEMFSQQAEMVEFEKPVEAKGMVEVWLQRLVEAMQGTMKTIIRRAARSVNEMGLQDFLFSHPAQIALLGLQFQWTADTQVALASAKTDKGSVTRASRKAEALLREMVAITLRQDLTRIQRISLETCITVHMHQKESSEELVRKKIRDPTDFEWLKQCRFYWRDERDTVIITICDVDFEYSFEYLGVKERLVITPLTDVCYVTLSQALGMFLGGAPAGPAGTGKTETTKDLGNTLGKYVVVFNCSDQMDYKGMGKIYKGLAQSGLWGCFDEFNRINLDVLSVCAQQVYCVLSAIRERKRQFVFTDGATVALDPRVGFFITMNPGYAGRQELPENLKALFRGVTMMVPNRQIIMKVKLAACGYQENEVLSKKFFVLYGLCEQQLSKQPHYDFGLRNILSVLRTAGASKRASPDKSEVFHMMRTLRDMNMSKFVAEDVPLFLSLIDDLFPGLKADRSSFPDISSALGKVVAERGLQAHAPWLNKCIQLYETYLVRHGIMLVGPSGAGKTAIMECLAAALTELGTKHVIWRMNPKAITAPQMFGRMDPTTGDWTDGVFAVLWRRAAKQRNQNTWIVLDGPVDAIWIENLNTVLTLANGDRILMTPQMKAFFEPENLANASPATVSRAGIIYVSDVELGWAPLTASWLQRRRPAEAALLQPCFDKHVGKLLDFVRLNLKPVLHNEAVCQVGTLLTLLDGVLAKTGAAGTAPASDAGAAAGMERVFLFCLAWSIGGLLDSKDRAAFDAELRTQTAALPKKADEGDTVFEYLVTENRGGWQPWRERVPSWKYPRAQARPKFAQLLIPTVDSARYEYLLTLVLSVQKASLLVGGPGTAKTSTINQLLSRFSSEEMGSKTMTFSSLTTPFIFQQAIEARPPAWNALLCMHYYAGERLDGCVEKRQGRTYGPAGGKTMAVVLDDISMPAINNWGDQVTNEIVRQLLDQGCVYSLDKPIGDLKAIVDTRYVAAMNVPGGGKNDIPNRLKRQFAIFNVPQPSNAAINMIFGALVQGRFDAETCGPDVVAVAGRLVAATQALWARVAPKMLPTPARFHYLFNMRDVSKVFQGVILASLDRFRKDSPLGTPLPAFGGRVTSPGAYLAALWVHECSRVFCDRMITHEDKAWVDGAIRDLSKQHFPADVARQLEEPLHFVDFLRPPVTDPETGEVLDAHPSFYESVPGGLPDIRKRVEALQRRFNEETRGAKLELVLFQDALLHLMRISRLLALDRGSALLVGVGGSGKQSLARLAAFIAGAFPFQITVTKMYNVTNLMEDLKTIYKIAGLKGQPVAFIFTDAEVKEEGFLEYVNQLLMTGEVAGLFPRDELDTILNDLRPAFKRKCPGVPDTSEAMYAFFLSRVRDRLHVVLCFSPVGAQFSRRAQQFPGLINGCTIDWFLAWPEEALTAVSSKAIDEFPMACPRPVKEQLKALMGSVHSAVTVACHEYFERFRRHVYVTPRSYLAFLAGYRELYSRKLGATRELASSINSGLAKMNEAKVDVNRMKGELAIKNAELAVATLSAEEMLKEISQSTAAAEKEKSKVAVIVDDVSKTAAEITAVKDDAERDLAQAQPALDAALAALNSITPKDITGLKALKNPPDIVKRIFDCVLLLRYYPVGKAVWQDCKGAMVLSGTYDEAVKMMGDIQFLTALQNFPKEGITDETVELLQPYFNAPDFNFDSAKKASGNVAGLCNWAAAMCTYHEVAKVVEPKIVALRGAEAKLKVAMREKGAALDELAVVQGRLDEMQEKFDVAIRQKQALEDDAASTTRRMAAANALLGALAGEEGRWTQLSKDFDDQIQRLTGDCAVASSFVSYLGPFNREFRELLLARDFVGACERMRIPATPDLKVSAFLADEAEVGEWVIQGLPTDDLSVQNGILVTRTTRFPVLVDPQGQGRAWLCQREAAVQLRIVGLADKSFRAALEECLALGRPLLIENIEEELDPVLDPVLDRRVTRKGRGLTMQLADKEVDYVETFRLFCTTRLPNPHFTPELSARVTVIDFTVTQAGLEDQLLGKLILKAREKTELEEQRVALVGEVQSYRKKIKQLEDDLLFRLSNSQGNLLDDTELVGVLASTKATAGEVNERLAGASEANRRISDACEEYRPVAHRAQLIYFLIAQFSTVNCMYQTSLAQFNGLYEAAIDGAERAALPAKRIAAIIDHMTFEIYKYIQRGLFERHKLIFAWMLTASILVSASKIKADDVNIFLRGGGALDINSVRKKPKEWIPDSVWLNVVALGGMDAFRDLADAVARGDTAWRAWYDAEAPERAPVPGYEERLSKFERTCIVKAWREDRTLIAAADMIADALGQRFVESVPLSMEAAWAESRTATPLICLLSPGSDPLKLVEDLAKRKKIKTLVVSMGQGQEIIARRYMATASAEGQWVLLQNTHLSLAYLSEVEQQMARLETCHENFRLWITAEPHEAFPIGLLQAGIKYTNEAPVGMKAGLRTSLQWVTQDMLDAVNRADWRQLLYIMCFLHSVVQERRKFGPVGWNVPYEFNQSDLSACTTFFQNHLLEVDAKRAPGPTWETVRYMVAAIQYGGRITDEFDKFLMQTYAERYFHQAALGTGYELHKEGAAVYSVPQGTEIEIFRKAVEDLPAQESPELFGMHPNADLTFRTLNVQAAVRLVLDTRPQGGGGGGGGRSREDTVDRICEDLLHKVPPLFEKEAVRERLQRLPGGPTQPLTVHLRQEIDRLSAVLALTAATLRSLRLAIAGTVALSGPLIDALEALFNARIPAEWLACSWEASTLGNWFLGLLQRHDQLAKWLASGRPKAYWLTGFFNPQGFLTAMKQEVNRKHAGDRWALDDVVMTAEVLHPPRDPDAIREAPSEGVYIYGLFLDGCAWSGKEGRLVDSEPKKLFCPLPVLHVTGVQAKDRKKVGVYETPTYSVKKRTGRNFITTFPLKTDDPPSKWTLRGVALLCSID